MLELDNIGVVNWLKNCRLCPQQVDVLGIQVLALDDFYSNLLARLKILGLVNSGEWSFTKQLIKSIEFCILIVLLQPF